MTYVIEFSHGGWYDGLGGIESLASRAYSYPADKLAEAREDAQWLNKSSFHRDMWSVKALKSKGEESDGKP